ncbi:hypothetical protein [Nitrosospira sp. Is2]|uniref:hypothetical protein n=1 Tax=Nitrosospira sp. Is2 TaxID=3080532 RepID=UPI002952DAB7|nr:hypothetical protein [Nitrosospira sp. Is2]WON74537.1 hypothetical protein R5L00_03350 [Nitrosospira sp. Is2]
MIGTLALSEKEETRTRRVQKEVDDYMKYLEAQAGKPLSEMGVIYLAKLLRETAALFFIERGQHKQTQVWQRTALMLIDRQEGAERKRVENHPINVVKRQFQEAVRANIDGYNTIADAVRDLRSKPQFEDIPEKTLRSWTREVWTKPTKVGRPRKLVS